MQDIFTNVIDRQSRLVSTSVEQYEKSAEVFELLKKNKGRTTEIIDGKERLNSEISYALDQVSTIMVDNN